MNKHPSEKDEWQRVRRVLLDAVGEPSDEDLRIVRESVKRRIAGQQKSGRRFWIWNTAAAVAGVLAVLAVVDLRVKVPPSQPAAAPLPLSSPVIARRELSQVTLLSGPAHLRKARPSAGIRSVAWTTQRDGSSQLKLTTADPDIVILLPLDRKSDEHEN